MTSCSDVIHAGKQIKARTVVVSPLVDQPLLKPEIRGSNPGICKLYLPVTLLQR